MFQCLEDVYTELCFGCAFGQVGKKKGPRSNCTPSSALVFNFLVIYIYRSLFSSWSAEKLQQEVEGESWESAAMGRRGVVANCGVFRCVCLCVSVLCVRVCVAVGVSVCVCINTYIYRYECRMTLDE